MEKGKKLVIIAIILFVVISLVKTFFIQTVANQPQPVNKAQELFNLTEPGYEESYEFQNKINKLDNETKVGDI